MAGLGDAHDVHPARRAAGGGGPLGRRGGGGHGGAVGREGHGLHVDLVAAGLEADRGLDRVLEPGDDRRRDLVAHLDRDGLAGDRAGRLLDLRAHPVDPVLGRLGGLVVVRVAPAGGGAGERAGGGRVGRRAGHRAGGAAGRLQRLLARVRLQRHEAVLVVGLAVGGRLVEVEDRADLGDRLAGPEHRREHPVELALEAALVGALQLEALGGRGGARGVGVGALQDVALGVGDGHVGHLEAGDRHRDELGDALDLARVQLLAGLGGDHDRGRGGLLLVGEQLLLGHRDLDRRRLDRVEAADGARQLALGGADEVDAVGEVGGAQVGLVEDLEAHAAAVEQVGGGEVQAGLVEVRLGHLHGLAAVGELVADAGVVELGGDGRGVVGARRRDQRRVRRLPGEAHEEEDPHDEEQHGAHDEPPARSGEALPETRDSRQAAHCLDRTSC